MADAPLSCPFCNAQFSRAEAGTQGWLCPGCHELLPAHLQETLKAQPQAAPPAPPEPARRSRLANWKIAAGLILVMLVMARISVEFAVRTIEYRRKNDPRL